MTDFTKELEERFKGKLITHVEGTDGLIAIHTTDSVLMITGTAAIGVKGDTEYPYLDGTADIFA